MNENTAKLPPTAGRIAQEHPEIWQAYAALGEACAEAGPLESKTIRLVKLALAIGVGSEGAVHSHARRAVSEGIARDALKQVALLAITTIGFPQAMRAATWIEDVVVDAS